jgi:hypothetical protein
MSNTSEIGYPNRTKWIVFFGVLIALPSILLSEWSLDKIQEKVVNTHAEKPWAADLQKYIAHGFNYTLRQEKAAPRYAWAANLYANQNNYTEAGEQLYSQAVALEDCNKKWEAKPIYEQLERDYRDYPVGAKAHGALVRLNTMSRP